MPRQLYEQLPDHKQSNKKQSTWAVQEQMKLLDEKAVTKCLFKKAWQFEKYQLPFNVQIILLQMWKLTNHLKLGQVQQLHTLKKINQSSPWANDLIRNSTLSHMHFIAKKRLLTSTSEISKHDDGNLGIVDPYL